MKTITEKLAEALRTVDEYCQAGLNSEQPNHWESALQDAMQAARTTLAEYDSIGRPLAVGDRVRVRESGYLTLNAGDESIVALIDEDGDLFVFGGKGRDMPLFFLRKNLERVL